MENIHEIISFSSELPIRVFFQEIGSIAKHWHTSIEILFILSGEVDITVDDQSFHLLPDDVLLVNSNALHELYAASCELALFQINLTKLSYFEEYSNLYFNCCSCGQKHTQKYDYLRYLLARLIKAQAEKNVKLATLSLLSMLLDELVTNFSEKQETIQQKSQKHLQRLKSITGYIQKNFRTGISLAQLAESEHLSSAYLSRFFAQHFGMSFTEYINKIRMEYAVNELLTSDTAIADIALNNGFSDVRAFVSLFKKNYHELPSTYRKKNSVLSKETRPSNGINYFSVSSFSSLSSLAKYLSIYEDEAIGKTHPVKNTTQAYISADYTAAGTHLHHNFHRICCVGAASDLLNAQIQDMLCRAQKEIHFEYIKFHGILCDDMMLYHENTDGSLYLSFTLVDKVMDFLISIGLKPLLQLSFMPKQLASIPDKTNFYIEYNVSPPKNIQNWNHLVRELINHFIDRYSLEEVRTWLFCVWNEPDTSTEMFGFENIEDFLVLYKNTYDTVKSIDPRFIFGTPSLLLISEIARNWDMDFFRFCVKNDCIPDFLNIHYYDDSIDLLNQTYTSEQKMANMLNTNENAFSQYLDTLYGELSSYVGRPLPVYLTEWNLTVSHRNLINDTCFKSCYIAKNLLENYDRIESYGYWSLTDYLHEQQLPNQLFHGGLGLFTMNGIPKPPYYVFKYLSKLGDECIGRGNGWFITKGQNNIQIALYNYEHYSRLFASGELFDMTMTNRYTPFTMLNPEEYHLTLRNVPGIHAIIREYYINREHGSCFDQWVAIGAPEQLRPEDEKLLNDLSAPGIFIHHENIEKQTLNLKILLQPLEFRFIIVEFHS